MRAVFRFLFAGILTLPILLGCGPRLKEEDLGTVISAEEDIPGADEPYELPDSGVEPAPKPEPEAADEGS